MLNEYIHSSNSLVSIIKNSQIPWIVKDIESKFIYANEAELKELNLPKNFNIEGKLDKEIPSQPCQELWEDFVRDDKLVMTKKKKISGIEIAFYGTRNNKTLIPRYFEKSPLYDDDKKIIGVIGCGGIIDTPSLLYYMNQLNRKSIQFDAPNEIFTKRELEVIFWAQQRLSIKDIARRLGIAPRTVEVHIKNIYNKADVHNLSQLIDYCKHTGLDVYIPSDFIRKGVQIIA